MEIAWPKTPAFVQMKPLGKSQEVIEQMKEHSIPRFFTIPVKKKLTALLPKSYVPHLEKKTHLYPPFTTKQKPQKASSTLRVQLYVSAVMCWEIQIRVFFFSLAPNLRRFTTINQGGEISKMCYF